MDAIKQLRDLAVSESGFLFDPLSGSTFTINESGRTILDSLRQGGDRRQVLEALEQRFEVNGDSDLQRDLDEFMHLLRQNGLVPREFDI